MVLYDILKKPLKDTRSRKYSGRNRPHTSHICHFPTLNPSQAVCSTIDKRHSSASKTEPDTSRHNPQTKYVTLMKGLNDIPVCTVLEKINLVERLLSDEETVTYVKSAEEIRSREAERKRRHRIQLLDVLWERSKSCPEGLRVDDIGEFKLELVRRHNPHARRVRHIKGLNDVPVCVVRDELNSEWENRFIVSPGSLAPAYSSRTKKKSSDFNYITTAPRCTPRGQRPHSAPISQSYHNREQESTTRCESPLAQHSPVPFGDRSTSRTSSRVSVPKMSLLPPETYDNDLNDELDSIQALDILCSILQTNSLQTVQAWIEQATDDERNVVLKALRDMKDKGLLAKPLMNHVNNLASLPEDHVTVSYEKKWTQDKSVDDVAKTEPVISVPKLPEPTKTPVIATQTPVSVLSPTGERKGDRKGDRPPTRIQMTGLSRTASRAGTEGSGSRPSTMRSVRQKFLRSGSSTPAKDPGFSWKRRDHTPDVVSKA